MIANLSFVATLVLEVETNEVMVAGISDSIFLATNGTFAFQNFDIFKSFDNRSFVLENLKLMKNLEM